MHCQLPKYSFDILLRHVSKGGGGGGIRPPDFWLCPPRFSDLETCLLLIFLVTSLLSLRSKKLRKEVKEKTIPYWAQTTSKLEFHRRTKNQRKNNGGKFRFRQKKLRRRNRYRNSILVSVANTETRFWSYTTL